MLFTSSWLAHCLNQPTKTRPLRAATPQTKLPAALLSLLMLSLPVAAENWQFSTGVATLARQQPWQDIDADYQLLPMFSARYGNWQFGTSDSSLASYSWQFPADFKLQLGFGVRDLGYGAKTQTNKKLSEAAVFRGYQHPDPEAVFNAQLQWRWFFLHLGQQLNDGALALQAKAGLQLPLWQQQQGASLALLLEGRYFNEDLNQRLYGVGIDNQDLSVGRYAFTAEQSLHPAIALQLSYPLATQWQLLAVLSAEKIDDKLQQSPLLEKQQITELMLALNYHF